MENENLKNYEVKFEYLCWEVKKGKITIAKLCERRQELLELIRDYRELTKEPTLYASTLEKFLID